MVDLTFAVRITEIHKDTIDAHRAEPNKIPSKTNISEKTPNEDFLAKVTTDNVPIEAPLKMRQQRYFCQRKQQQFLHLT